MAAMTGKEIPASAQGPKLSILFALASSMAEALPGAMSRPRPGRAGLAGCADDPGSLPNGSNDGESMGDEKESRYKAMKKSSLKVQKMKRTFYYELARSSLSWRSTHLVGII